MKWSTFPVREHTVNFWLRREYTSDHLRVNKEVEQWLWRLAFDSDCGLPRSREEVRRRRTLDVLNQRFPPRTEGEANQDRCIACTLRRYSADPDLL